MGFFANKIRENAQRPKWQPKFPSFADDGNNFQLRELDKGEESSVPWVPAPATSHLLAFRYHPASKLSNFARDVLHGEQANKAPVPAGQTRVKVRATSVISIRFRPSGRRGVTEYQYTYADQAEADAVWQLLIEAEHPGEVVMHIMIPSGTQYRRVS